MHIERAVTAGGSGYLARLRPDGILDLAICGVWTVDDVDAFFAALVPVHDAARRRHGSVRMLIVVQAVQPLAVAMRVRHHAIAIKQAGDRRAFIWLTALAKLQIKRLRTSETIGVFTDRGAAEAWLLS